VDIDPKYATDAAKLFGMPGSPVVLARLTQEAAQASAQDETIAANDSGKYIAALYKSGFWFNPKVLAALGTDDEYRVWIQRQPSAFSDEFSEYVNGEGRCVAAHVRRAGESGTGYKAPYACIPLTDMEHKIQHQQGESALGGQAWFDKQRAAYVQEWAHSRLREILGVESLSQAPVYQILYWAEQNELERYLPAVFKA